jgi:hypothetical protein
MRSAGYSLMSIGKMTIKTDFAKVVVFLIYMGLVRPAHLWDLGELNSSSVILE